MAESDELRFLYKIVWMLRQKNEHLFNTGLKKVVTVSIRTKMFNL